MAVVAAFALAGWGAALIPDVRALDLAVLDAKFAVLARVAPIAAADPIVIIGIDDATLAAMPEPVTLSHRMLGEAFRALASAKPRAVGVDVILPDRSYDEFSPGADEQLITGLLTLRRVAPVVLGATTMSDGTPRRIHPPLLAAADSEGVDFALFAPDEDGRVRRFDDRLGVHGEAVSTLAGRLSEIMGKASERGLIQYALGNGFDYVPMRDLIDWAEAGDNQKLVATFGDRIVLVGYVLPHEDRKIQPVPLARWESGRDVPGVLVHAQLLRTELAGAIIRPAPFALQLALFALAAALWFIPTWRRRTAAFLALGVGSFAVSVVLLRYGVELPLGAAARVALSATAARSALEAWRVRRERMLLQTQFAGYVSPAVLAAILSGRLESDARHGRRKLCFLFADVRDFTALSEAAPPETVLDLLNRYFAVIIPVIHSHGGTIDNFRGDGLMAIFGAPNRLANPASSAVKAARELFLALAQLNRQLVGEGFPPLAIGVTLAYSDALVGNVGSKQRHNYTALGDGANVAARLQEVTKTSGFPLVATAALIAQLDADTAQGWVALGETPIRGHAPVQSYGWRPATE